MKCIECNAEIDYNITGYRCYLCDEWFCKSCIEKHCGIDKADWQKCKASGAVMVKDHNIARLTSDLWVLHNGFTRREDIASIIRNWKQELEK